MNGYAEQQHKVCQSLIQPNGRSTRNFQAWKSEKGTGCAASDRFCAAGFVRLSFS